MESMHGLHGVLDLPDNIPSILLYGCIYIFKEAGLIKFSGAGIQKQLRPLSERMKFEVQTSGRETKGTVWGQKGFISVPKIMPHGWLL